MILPGYKLGYHDSFHCFSTFISSPFAAHCLTLLGGRQRGKQGEEGSQACTAKLKFYQDWFLQI